jgi:hypothetical protein
VSFAIKGGLIFAGDLTVNGESMTGLAIHCEREDLMAARLPMYRQVMVVGDGCVGIWKSVKECMPDDEITVLVWCGGDATMAFHDSEVLERRGDSGWIMSGTSRVLIGVTHWCEEVLPPE